MRPRTKPLALDLANKGRSNCPWSGKLWAHAISTTYSVSGKHEALNVYYYAMSTHALEYSMAEYSLAAIALIDMARLEFQLNRGTSSADLLSTCTSCITTAYSLPIETADPMLRLERYSLFVTAAIAKDIEATRGLWTKVCRARRSSAEAWVLAADFETAHGSVANARSLYRQGAPAQTR
ncbi:hypothetical protein DL89DRAFT_254501 [Linderina pennispora]|uniref:Uncharacterized protein n=1 Tax=Linderina pennispora TaxID=61395 RepID=A0A1Y1WMB9_9FUNG|nr:uncharacterized protein DL89DRAFT_254501 [Linderina pennispora]ORX74710.1 hypothetical protein DL89DRAFT_254501 [Linderina pennispora]